MKAKALTETQRLVLEKLRDGLDATHGASGRSEHGGRMSAYWALVRRGLISSGRITAAGLAMLQGSAE